jgi:hypothetical protein
MDIDEQRKTSHVAYPFQKPKQERASQIWNVENREREDERCPSILDGLFGLDASPGGPDSSPQQTVTSEGMRGIIAYSGQLLIQIAIISPALPETRMLVSNSSSSLFFFPF